MRYTPLKFLLSLATAYTTPEEFTCAAPRTPSDTMTTIWHLSHDMTVPHIMEVTHTDCPFWTNRYGIPKGTVGDWKRGKRTPQDYLLRLITADLLTDQSGTELTYSTMQRLLTTADLCGTEEEFILTLHGADFSKKLLKDTWDFYQDFSVPNLMALTNTTRVTMHRTYDIPLRTIEDWTGRKSKPKDYILTFIATDLLAETYRD